MESHVAQYDTKFSSSNIEGIWLHQSEHDTNNDNLHKIY